MNELDGAKDRLAPLRSHLKRALGALRDRLVAIYETGHPGLLNVIVGSDDLEDLAAQTEYLDRDPRAGRGGGRARARPARRGAR